MTSEVLNLHISKNLSTGSKTKQDVEKCCFVAFNFGSAIFPSQGHFNKKHLSCPPR